MGWCRHQLANNAGVEGDVIVEKVFGKSWETGYNAMDDRIEDLLEAGIIDPAKVRHIAVMAYLSGIHPSNQHADMIASSCARVHCAVSIDQRISTLALVSHHQPADALLPCWEANAHVQRLGKLSADWRLMRR